MWHSTTEEVNKLIETPCEDDVLRRAFLFSVLTGMRHCDIQQLKWKQLEHVGDSWRINFNATENERCGIYAYLKSGIRAMWRTPGF